VPVVIMKSSKTPGFGPPTLLNKLSGTAKCIRIYFDDALRVARRVHVGTKPENLTPGDGRSVDVFMAVSIDAATFSEGRTCPESEIRAEDPVAGFGSPE